MMLSKEQRSLIRALEAQGFTVERTRKGHWLVRNAAGRAVVTMSGTSSDHRAWRNALARLKRAGLVWPPPRR
jgi:predicted RNA binding protein YcfA (HicA-like mRNA interferase family)